MFLKLVMLGHEDPRESGNFLAVFTVNVLIDNWVTDNFRIRELFTLQKVRLQLGGFSTGSAVYILFSCLEVSQEVECPGPGMERKLQTPLLTR